MGKNNEKLLCWSRKFGPIIVLVISIIGVVYGYGRLNERVDRCESDILAGKKADYKRDEDNEDQGKAIVRVETKVDNIQKSVDRIESLLSNERTRPERTRPGRTQ